MLWLSVKLDSQFVMLGGRQTIFSTPYFQFENTFDFLFSCICDYFLFLNSWHHYKISVGTLNYIDRASVLPFQKCVNSVSDLANSVFYRFRYLKFRFIFFKPFFVVNNFYFKQLSVSAF